MALIYLGVFLTGCSMSQGAFLDDLAVAECDLKQRCLAPEVLTFNGWSERDACERDARSVWSDYFFTGCAYDPSLAADCVDELTALIDSCDLAVPAACEQMRSSCALTD